MAGPSFARKQTTIVSINTKVGCAQVSTAKMRREVF